MGVTGFGPLAMFAGIWPPIINGSEAITWDRAILACLAKEALPVPRYHRRDRSDRARPASRTTVICRRTHGVKFVAFSELTLACEKHRQPKENARIAEQAGVVAQPEWKKTRNR